jgi:hypothetical protein
MTLDFEELKGEASATSTPSLGPCPTIYHIFLAAWIVEDKEQRSSNLEISVGCYYLTFLLFDLNCGLLHL